jgi:hypothetical protein
MSQEPPKPPPRFPRLAPRPATPLPATQSEVLDRLGLMHEALEARSANIDARLTAEAKLREVTDRRLEAFHGELAILRGALTGDSSPPPTPEPKSKTVAGRAKGVGLAGMKYGSYVLLGLSLAAKAAIILKPELSEPIGEIRQMLGIP